MKASKILAGLSAASIAASMLSMISFADDTAATIASGTIAYEKTAAEASWGVDTGYSVSLKDTFATWEDLTKYEKVTVTAEISDVVGTTADKFGLSFYDMGSSNWSWNLSGDAAFVDGKVSYDLDLASINPKGDEEVGDWGIQAYINDAVAGENYTANITYTITATEKAEGTPTEETPTETTEYNTEVTVNPGEHEYGGDWGSDGNIPLKVFQEAAKYDSPVQITLNSTRLEGYDYALAAMGDQHGWAKIYNEGAEAGSKFEWKAKSITGVTLKSSLSAEELDAADYVVLQNDGYFVYPSEAKDYEFTFTISPEAVKSFVANAEDEPAEDGSLWGGSLFQVYGIKINSMNLKFNADPQVVNAPSDEEGTLNAFLQFAVSDWSQSRWIDNDGTPGISVPINEDGSYSISYDNIYDVWKTDATSNLPGALVFTLDIPNVYDGPEGTKDENGKKYDDDNVRQLLYSDFAVTVDSILVDGEPIEFDASKFNFGNIENQTTNYRVELYNEYGTTKDDPGFDPALINGDTVTVNFTVSGMDSSPVTPEPENKDKIVYSDEVYTIYETEAGTYYIVNANSDTQNNVAVVDAMDEFPYDIEKVDTYILGQTTIDGDNYTIMSVVTDEGDTYYYLVKISQPISATGAIVPADWPVISQLNYSVPYDYEDTTSEDLFDYIKAIHDADPDANVEFRFQAIGTQEGSPVAAFLKVWEEDKTSSGKQIYVVKGTNDWGKYKEVGTEKVKVQDLNDDGTLKWETGKEKLPKIGANGEYVVKNDGSYDTEDVEVTYDGSTVRGKTLPKKPVMVEKWVDADGKRYDDADVEPKFAWHNYYITNEGLLNVQSTSDMAAGVTNNNRFSKLTAAQISTIRANNGIYYDDQYGSQTYGHFIVFGDGQTVKEYSFTLSASAIDQILEKSIRSNGGSLPYSTNIWKAAGAAMHGPIWLQAHSDTVPGAEGEKSLNARVYAVTTVKTPDQIPYMYGKADYKGMYTPVADPDASSSTSSTTTTTTAAASSPAASAASGDANADTGAAAGFGIAGLLLAGAAMVCAKKKH